MIFDNFFDMMGTVMIARIIDIVDREVSLYLKLLLCI